EVGDGVRGFSVGDRVISNGPHAEFVCVPEHLCAKIPAGISDDEAAFTVLAAIGLQGIRLVDPTLGETVVVVGLGLIGLVTVQLLLANGCRVLGVDLDPTRLALARQFGAETVDLPGGADPVAAALAFTDGRGVDGVVITAASKSNTIMSQAAAMCRKRGRIVLVGVVGLELNRSDFYKKELSFQVSCSYGPGRYDPAYEEGGHDYPVGFVRWTEQRNFVAILDLMASGSLDLKPLVNRRVALAQAAEAYDALTKDRDALGIVLTYPEGGPVPSRVVGRSAAAAPITAGAGEVVVGVIGAGNFARLIAMPSLARTQARLRCVADLNGVAAGHARKKFGFQVAASDPRVVLDDAEINTIFVLTRHDAHGPLVLEALEAGKHVFVEKPLCLDADQLGRIREAYRKVPAQQLLVGFNRRFSPHAVKMRELLAARTEPLCMSMMVNAGVSPPDSWTHDPKVGGGRIIGEGCHWIDLMSFLAASPVVRVTSMMIGESAGVLVRDDKTSITLLFADGSIGTLHYFGNGHKSYPKETLEVLCDGKVLRLENFRVLRGYGWRGFKKMKLRRMDKGHQAEYASFVNAVASGGSGVIPFEELDNVMQATFGAVESARTGQPISIA
ncbi:MAG: bi-domain-containing oxidoreductase, partial [Phycisphaerae bacterium]|nr:bi-domain-containing oxidoreductase [Phycisphaerae bacterium]